PGARRCPRGDRAPARGRRDAPALSAAPTVPPLGLVAPAAGGDPVLRSPDRLPADGLLLVLTAEESSMPDPILEASALTKHFGALRAVHLSLTVEAGELRSLIGPTGPAMCFCSGSSLAGCGRAPGPCGSAAATSPAGRGSELPDSGSASNSR